MSYNPKLKRVREEEVPDRAPAGLSDGGHVILACSNCRAGLVDIWITRPDQPFEWKVRANCPFCGDKSFVEVVKGGFHYGGYGVVKDDDPDEDIPSTVVDHFDIEGDQFVFTLKKARHDAKPVRI
jgi:hypothetical protein